MSVPVAAALFAVLFAVGGSVDVGFGSVLAAMVGVHLLVGIGEALITGAVATVVATRPDLVSGPATSSRLRPAGPCSRRGRARCGATRTAGIFVPAGLLVGLGLALLVSPFASPRPPTG